MTNKEATFDTASPGTQVGQGVSYGGSAVDTYSESAGGDMAISNVQSMHGGQSVRFTSTGATSVCLMRWSGYTGKKLGTRWYMRLDALPGAETIVGHIRHASGVLCQAQVDTSGVVKFTTASSGTVFQTAAGMSINTWYRIGLWMENGTTSANGKLKAGVYAGDSTSPLGGTIGNATNVNFGTLADVASFQIGKVAGAGAAINGYLDTARGDDAATDLLGPFASAPPVLTIIDSETIYRVRGSATNSGVLDLDPAVGSPEDPISITGPDGSGWFDVELPDPRTGDIELVLSATNSGGTVTEDITIPQGAAGTVRKDFLTSSGVGAAGTMARWPS